MTALFAGLTTLDVLHRLDHVPDPGLKVTSTDFTMAAGGPATNAAVTYAALEAAARSLSTDEAVAGSPDPATRADAPLLMTALGEGPVSAFLAADLATAGVRVLDATVAAPTPTGTPGLPASAVSSPAEAAAPTYRSTPPDERDAAQASAPREPAVSSIIEHPSGRMVASTNARLNADPACVAADRLGARPPHLRVLDGGSWKNWLTPLLGFVDVAVVSEDFAPPLLVRADGEQVAGFLRGFGITRVVRTRGERPVQYWWDGVHGEVPVHEVPDASTMGAGDAFHGAFVWALERAGATDPERLIRFASAVAGVSVSSFGTRQWLTSPVLAELVRAW